MNRKRRLAIAAALCVLVSFAAAVPAAADEDLAVAEAVFSAENAGSAECPLGRLAAEAVRQSSGADAAIVCGGYLGSDLPAGAVTEARIEKIFPVDVPLATAAVSPLQLKEILENGLSLLVLDLENGDRIDREASASVCYPQIAGLSIRCDATALPGDRVLKMELNGAELDPGDTEPKIILCASEELLSGALGGPCVEGRADTGLTLRSAFKQYIGRVARLEKLPSAIREVGSGDASIVGQIMPDRAMGVLLLVFLLAFGAVRVKTKEKTEHDDF